MMTVRRDTTVMLSADIAVWNDFAFGNATAGRFELLLNGAVVDSLLITTIEGSGIFRGVLSGETTLTSGQNVVAVRITRPWLAPSLLGQYIDNVKLTPMSIGSILRDRGVPGVGIDDAPGLQREFNLNSAAAQHAGPAANSGAPAGGPSGDVAGIIE